MTPPPSRILIVKTSSLGDVIHALPVASDIARALPGTRIDWVVEEGFADLPALHPAVGRVVRSALRRWKKRLLSSATLDELRAFRRAVRAHEYDLVLDLQGLIKSAWITRQAIGRRAGFDRRSAREPLASLAYHDRHTVPRHQHAVMRNRQLAAAALGYQLADLTLDYGIAPGHRALPAESPAGLQENPGNATLTPPFAILLTATSRDDKLWREDDWIGLGDWLAERGIQSVLAAGSALERARAERIAAAIAGARVLPPSGVAALAGTITGAALAVGVDTGLTHLACALDIPTLALYTATDPGLTGVVGPRFHNNLGGRNTPPSLAQVCTAAEAALASAA